MGPRVDVLSYQKARKKWTCDLLTHTPYLLLAVCLYKKNCSCKQKERGTYSSYARLSSQKGGLLLDPLFFVLQIVLSPSSPFLYFHTDLQPARNSWLSQFDPTENYRGSIKGVHSQREFTGRSCLYRTHWCHTEAWIVRLLAQGRDETKRANSSQGRESKE